MPETGDKSSSAEDKANADEIKWQEIAQHGPRGNVHSEPDKDAVTQDLPPPMPG